MVAEEIHVIPVRLCATPEIEMLARSFLPEKDLAQAPDLPPERRARSLLTQALLRTLIAGYLSRTGEPVTPAEIVLNRGPSGKPHLPVPVPLHFNLSHSGSLAIFAFSLDTEIGVDLEELRTMAHAGEIADRFFAPEESTDFRRLTKNADPKHAQLLFFSCWTRKEAYVKAIGTGLDFPLDRFRVSLNPCQPSALLRIDDDDRTCWCLHSIASIPGFLAALACRCTGKTLYEWPLLEPTSILLAQ
jgi:4'-phosphopantetheinyl transferase